MPKRGSIILVPFPFTDLSGSKVRPALVISKSLSGEDVIVVFISSKKPAKKFVTDVPIQPSRDNGLKTESVIVCSKIATLDKKVILGELGVITSGIQKEVDKKLCVVLSI